MKLKRVKGFKLASLNNFPKKNQKWMILKEKFLSANRMKKAEDFHRNEKCMLESDNIGPNVVSCYFNFSSYVFFVFAIICYKLV